MREKKYYEECSRSLRTQEIYRLRVIEGMSVRGIEEKLGISHSSVYRALAIFERENTQQSTLMKRQGKDVTPSDYQELLKELSDLRKDLARERLRADFYEEMVAFGKDVYGVDLKKAGTK